MRKFFLKPLALLMTVCMLVSLVGITGAAKDDTEVEIIICDSICPQKAQKIINSINGEIGISPMGIFCILGHNLAITSVTQIEHRVWSTSPRCRQTIFRVNYCTRSSCNHSITTTISTAAIHCC